MQDQCKLFLRQDTSSDVVFDTPKPTRLMRRILQLGTALDSDDIVVDFFAGTGTTMDAMFSQNAEDGGKRRCILVQLPEPLEGAETKGWKSIADITKARIRAAGARHKGGETAFAGDVGFRVFKLDTSNIRSWVPDADKLDQSLLAHLEHVEADRTENDVLYEVLLKLGLDLCVPIEERVIVGQPVQFIGGGVLVTCLSEQLKKAEAVTIAEAIPYWLKEMGTAGEVTCVFRDSAFDDDVTKTNVAAILEQRGVAKVRSL